MTKTNWCDFCLLTGSWLIQGSPLYSRCLSRLSASFPSHPCTESCPPCTSLALRPCALGSSCQASSSSQPCPQDRAGEVCTGDISQVQSQTQWWWERRREVRAKKPEPSWGVAGAQCVQPQPESQVTAKSKWQWEAVLGHPCEARGGLCFACCLLVLLVCGAPPRGLCPCLQRIQYHKPFMDRWPWGRGKDRIF